MSKKLRIVLAILGAVSFFILFYLMSDKSITAAFFGAAIGFSFIWLLAGLLHWYWSRHMYYTYKNIEYMNKLASEDNNDELQQDKT